VPTAKISVETCTHLRAIPKSNYPKPLGTGFDARAAVGYNAAFE
jgi:hypothetical protein